MTLPPTPKTLPVRRRRAAPIPPTGSTPSSPPPEPELRPPLPAAPRPPRVPGELAYSSIFLAGLAAILAFIDPVVINLQAQLSLSLAGVALGIGLGWWGGRQGRPALAGGGGVVLWAVIAAGILTQPAPIYALPGTTLAPRLALVGVALVGWLLLSDLPGWVRRAVPAAALPSALLIGWMWISVPSLARDAGFYRLAVDSHGNVYATDADVGTIWVFAPDGSVRGKLWPRRVGTPLTPGPGVQPAQIRRQLLPLRVGPTPTPGGPSEPEFPTCGMVIDGQDRLYIVDILLRQMLRFSAGGQLDRAWPLVDTYQAASDCLALDSNRLYVADNSGNHVYIFDYDGRLQGTWTLPTRAWGISATPTGELAILYTDHVELRRFPEVTAVRQWNLPPTTTPLEVPYQTIFVRRNGEIIVSNIMTGTGTGSRLLRYSPNGDPLSPISIPAGPPTSAGDPPTAAGPAGIAEDAQGRLYVADFNLRIIHRFNPDGQRDAIWKAVQDEEGD